jgi:pimeloyl-ACP methyl ester carboxylesterase
MNQDQTQVSGQVPTIPNVLLVHGAWADGSSWAGVIPLLRERGHTVVAVQLALNSLADDVAHVRQVLADRSQGPTVLVGHSYGGAVISGAAAGQANAIALVYASAFAPDAGESLGALSAKYPAVPLGEHLQPDARGKLWIDPAKYNEVFCQDVDAVQAGVMAAAQGPLAGAIFGEQAGPAAWHTLPSWYFVSTEDRAIAPDLERFFAGRMGASTVEEASSHASPVSHPREITELIFAAARAGVRA